MSRYSQVGEALTKKHHLPFAPRTSKLILCRADEAGGASSGALHKVPGVNLAVDCHRTG